MSNEYTPWIELGMTESDYFKMRYIDSQLELSQLRAQVERYREAIKHHIDACEWNHHTQCKCGQLKEALRQGDDGGGV